MRSLMILILACVAAVALGTETCYSKQGANLKQFNGRTQTMNFPCKYWALRQQKCGKYTINLSPGHRWLYPKYFLDTLWLGVFDTETGLEWEGRTTNKIAVKFYNTNSTTMKNLFNKKNTGGLNTDSTFKYGRTQGVGVYIEDNANTFRVTFVPWDPDNKADFPYSDWKFECFDNNVVLNEFPQQMCGGSEKKAVENMAISSEFGLAKRFRANVIYYHVFTNPDIVHTNPRCTNATSMLMNKCSSHAQRLTVINNCKEILHNYRHTRCVTQYNCDPMDVFNDCVAWGCKDTGFEKDDEFECERLAYGIDFCADIASSGNLTARVRDAKCYKDFLSIRTDL